MKLTNNENGMIYCLGSNKEGVKCPRALECKRYIREEVKGGGHIDFPEGYDIKNCEIFVNVNFKNE